MTTLFADSCARRPKEIVHLVMDLVGFLTPEHGQRTKYDPLDDAGESFGRPSRKVVQRVSDRVAASDIEPGVGRADWKWFVDKRVETPRG
jgi:hypothetical protein